jgi:hypothetical protein
MIRSAIISLIICVPLVAFAAGSEAATPTSLASLLLQSAIAAMQLYLTSKLPPIEKRLSVVEQTVADFVDGVVR